MAKCERCGKKVSAFVVTSQGLCPECVRLLHPVYVDEEEIKKSDVVEDAIKDGELPELPCVSPKALKLTDSSLIFVEKRKNTTIPIQSIASFSNKKPSFMTNGTITVKLNKGNDTFIGTGLGSIGFGGEMSAIYKPEYTELAELYEKRIANWNSTPAPAQQPAASAPSINDLRALKQLVDEGVLTEEEFAAKKKQLLGI